MSAVAGLPAAFVAALQPAQVSASEEQGTETRRKDVSGLLELGGRGDALDGDPSDPIEAEKYVCTTKCAIEGESSKCKGEALSSLRLR